MGESDRYIEYKNKKQRFTLGQQDNAIVNLIVVNIVVFMLLLVMQVIYYLFEIDKTTYQKQVVEYFTMSASLETLFHRPWTLLVYMFSNVGVLELLGNMIWLYSFGSLLQNQTSNKTIFPVFIYGGLVGGIVFLLLSNFVPAMNGNVNESWLQGSQMSVLAMVVAGTSINPRYKFFTHLNGGIPVWVLMLIYILIDFSSMTYSSKAHILSHLAAALAGFYFIYLYKNGHDTGKWMSDFYHWLMHLFTPSNNSNHSQQKGKIFYNTAGRMPFKKVENFTQQKVDEILDKINQKGIENLTEEERQILKKAADDEGL
jgi:hypothetical protein